MKRKYELDEIKTIIKSILDLPESNKLYIHGEALREIICKKLWPGGTDIYIDNLEISDFGSNKWALGLYSYSSEGWNNKYACNNIAACSRYIAKDKLDIIWRKFKSDINKDPLKSDILASAYDINSFRANLKDFYDKYLTKDISLDQALDEGIIVNRSNRELLVHNLNCGLYHYRNKYSNHYLNANGYEKERILSDNKYVLNKDVKAFLNKKAKIKPKKTSDDKLKTIKNVIMAKDASYTNFSEAKPLLKTYNKEPNYMDEIKAEEDKRFIEEIIKQATGEIRRRLYYC